jgi:hypothetical protein
MGHRDFRTTLIYADYEPGDDESSLVDAAFADRSPVRNRLPRSRARERLSRLRNRSPLG